MDTSGRAVLFAGVTVVIAMLGQLLVGVAFLRGPAVASSLTVLLTMLAAITLLPAVLSKLGRGIDRLDPFHLRSREHSDSGFWERWAGFVQRRPWLCAGVSLAILLVLLHRRSSRCASARRTQGTDAKSTTTYQAYQLIEGLRTRLDRTDRDRRRAAENRSTRRSPRRCAARSSVSLTSPR